MKQAPAREQTSERAEAEAEVVVPSHRFRWSLKPTELVVARKLLGAMRGHPWLLPIVIVLNISAFLFESVGLSLLIPVLLSLASLRGEFLISGGGGHPFLEMIRSIAEVFEGPNQTLILVGLILLSISLRSAFAFASAAAFAYVSGKIGHSLRARAFRRIVSANYDYIASRPPGMLLNALGTETWRVAQGVNVIARLITHGSAVLVFLVVMFLVSWKFTALIFIGLALVMGLVQVITSRAKRIGDQAVRDNTALAGRMTQGLGGLDVIRLFGREEQETERFRTVSDRVRRTFLRLDLMNALPPPVMGLLFAALVAVLILSARPEDMVPLVLCLALLQRIQPHAERLMNARIALLNLSGALDLLSDIVERREAEPLPSGSLPARTPRQAIRFRNVRYRYPSTAADAISDVTFDIKAGATTALVGASGAGKSTIAHLVCRQIDPVEGEVFIDETPLRALDLASWRERLAIVPQDIYLFDTTLRENILYGRLDASPEDLVTAARLAGVMDFVDALPDGLETRVGERGTQFSGGQRQRIALARALIRKPDVIVLDEATNALDNFSAALVHDAIDRASAGRTLLIIAHRMAGIMGVDHVIVLDHGRVIEQGPPRELLAQEGAFAKFVAAESI